ncbi:MAG: FAD-binding protein [Planctomycetota bacterium]|nr:MAG: FAD-binding protein [Planctomycetota bacterium]
MSTQVPQHILDALTRVEMPPVPAAQLSPETIAVDGMELPLYRCGMAVIGSGAAGLRAAVEAKRRGLDVLICSMSLYGGTSACSGSDKQTLHTAGTARSGDDFRKLAAAIGGGGCMDHDTAYIEAVGSINALAGLQYLGLPLPQDRYGAVLRYQTDHDEVGRATSCGPRTSRLMVKVLAEEAIRLGIPFLRKCEAIRIITAGEGDQRRAVGAVVIDQERRDQDWGLAVVLCEDLVLASGGPGELYRDSVYPRHCYGSLGMAIEAGIAVTNLSESQFGIGTRRTEFPWNLSGTYVQVIPYIYSVDAEGQEHNFLADYYRTTQELCSNVFRKGYQWPFHATRMEDFGSSLVDLAIDRESRAGRTVVMDFLRNPQPGADGKAFSLDNLDADVRTYLENNDALQETPIERLQHMNPLAIELYRMHGHDLATDPLPFNVSNQHMNGGVAVDAWNESSLPHCFAVGEVAGTHGVTRPGGSALNAGQVGGLRVASHCAARGSQVADKTFDQELSQAVSACAGLIRSGLKSHPNALAISAVREEIQGRMSEKAGFICQVDELPPALQAAQDLRRRIWQAGLAITRPSQAVDIFRWRHLALTSEAVLATLVHYVGLGGGSRGARAYLAADGEVTIHTRHGPLSDVRYRVEKPEHQQFKITVEWQGDSFSLSHQALRPLDNLDRIFFEKHWGDYLTNQIHHAAYTHAP